MLNSNDEMLLERILPGLGPNASTAGRRLLHCGRVLRVPAGALVFGLGDTCDNYLIVLDGRVRVQVTTPTGREFVLYRVGKGQSCVLTTSCLLATEHYPAEAIAETPVTALALGARDFHRGLAEVKEFREFVFESLGRRLSEVMLSVERLTGGKIDCKLARFLVQSAGPDGRLRRTHQEIAREVGSAREVVSRHLKRFELAGWVHLGRSAVTLVDRPALESLAGEEL